MPDSNGSAFVIKNVRTRSQQHIGYQTTMTKHFSFTIRNLRFDENYHPSDNTRLTTNFANLARGKSRQQNLRNALKMINNSFNALASWDNPNGERYIVELDIISVDFTVPVSSQSFPSIEVLKTNINDHKTDQRIEGIVGNRFSSYLRDYDFSVLHNKSQKKFSKPPVICLSVSDRKIYHRSDNRHPVLGVEYQPNEISLTERYFYKMGLQVCYFMPPNSVAPLAFVNIDRLRQR